MKKNIGVITVCICGLIFILSLVPVLYTGRYDFATGDDYAYGAAAHLAYVATGSVWQAVKAAAAHVVRIYHTHQGTWMSIFLFDLQPEVFGDDRYACVPWIMVIYITAAFGFVIFRAFRRFFDLELPGAFAITFIILTILIQFIPYKANAIFWFNGAVHYTIPYGLMLISLWLSAECILNLRPAPFIALTLIYAVLGGMSYPAAVAAPVGMAGIYAFCLIDKRIKSRKDHLLLLIPILLELIGLVISYLSPGNWKRAGDDFGLSAGRGLFTIADCFVQAAEHFIRYIGAYPFILIAVLAAVLILLYSGNAKSHAFHHPFIVTVLMLVWNACVYAPEIYSGVQVSEGVDDTYFWSFTITLFAIALSLAGWLSHILKRQVERPRAIIAGWAVILVLCLVFRHGLADTAFKQCLDYTRKGYGENFREQMLLQQKLLETDEQEVVIPSTNAFNGPILNMPVTEDPEAWTNEVTARFYGKSKVIGMDADEWHTLYGM